MIVLNVSSQKPFTTKDGSQIRSILDCANAPVRNQSLAEASIPAGRSTDRHYHKKSEEFYFLLEGEGTMEIDGETAFGRTGRRDPDSSRRLAPNHGLHRAPLPLLLRASVFARRHLLHLAVCGTCDEPTVRILETVFEGEAPLKQTADTALRAVPLQKSRLLTARPGCL